MFNESPELCAVFPENAAVNSTGSTPTDGSTQTTPTPENFQSCGFEENTCEYSSSSKDKWIRTNAEELSSSNKPVPGGIDKGYFAYVSGDLGEPKSTLLLESKMHDETIATCMHFFYNIQVFFFIIQLYSKTHIICGFITNIFSKMERLNLSE